MSVNLKQIDGGIQFTDSEGKVLLEIGRGTTDTDITYLATYNADGELCYIHGDAAQTGITVTATKP